MDLADVDTPAAIVDLDAVERNVARMQRYCDAHGLRFRPHIKSHKLPYLAHLQLSAGAVGITCQKLGEAEVMAAAGIRDILITYPIVGPIKLERLVALASEVRVSIAGDSDSVARGLSSAVSRAGIEVGFLVDCDTGFGRTGVQQPGAAADLARLVARLPGLRLAGLMTFPTVRESGPWLSRARELIEQEGLAVDCVSGGGTPTAFLTHEVGGITEVRAGTYIYGDTECVANGTVALEDCALRVISTVVSRPTRDRAIVDAGSKTLSSDHVPGDHGAHGIVVEYPDARIDDLNEEHGIIRAGASQRLPAIGERVTIIPNHVCPVSDLHDQVVAHRAGRVVALWPVLARGKQR